MAANYKSRAEHLYAEGVGAEGEAMKFYEIRQPGCLSCCSAEDRVAYRALKVVI